jgi:hypothetical protein
MSDSELSLSPNGVRTKNLDYPEREFHLFLEGFVHLHHDLSEAGSNLTGNEQVNATHKYSLFSKPYSLSKLLKESNPLVSAFTSFTYISSRQVEHAIPGCKVSQAQLISPNHRSRLGRFFYEQ